MRDINILERKMITLAAIGRNQEVKQTTTPALQKAEKNLFSTPSVNTNEISTKPEFWNENTRAILYNITKNTGIAPYTPTVLKDDNTAIKHAQKHLIDLLKYYEGDNYHYYEAITIPYKDGYGSLTCGFGELTDKPRTQEIAYKNLGETIEKYTKEVKRFLNVKLGKETYENLPNSIKEGLIDLCYNKGLSRISTNKQLLNAIESKDYPAVINNLDYVYSGKTNAKKDEDPGLYRRSLNRMILAARDLKGKELDEAKKIISSFYKKALNCHKENKSQTTELNKIYENFQTGKISGAPVNVESGKIKVTDKYKGKGVFAVAQDAYTNIKDKGNVTFKEFYEEFKRINRNPQGISLGTELNVPLIKNITAQGTTEVSAPVNAALNTNTNKEIPEQKKAEKTETKTQDEKPKKGFWKRVGDGIKSFFKSIGKVISGFFNLFSSCSNRKETECKSGTAEEEKTQFQKMLNDPEVKIIQDGDFQLVTKEHTVKKGESIWRIARKYGMDENILCANNNIKNKNQISEGQTLNIQKLGYKVEKGDNLYRIAKKFGLTIEILKDINNIDDVDKLDAGQMLEIPGFIYTVRPKDTLYAISKRVGVKLDDLIKINNLDKDGIISPGQQIKIIYNDSDFAISDDKKTITVDKKTNTTTELIDMSGVVNLKNRTLLKQKRKINGKVAATRAVFNPTKSGALSGKTIIVNAGHGYSQSGIDAGTPGRKGLEDEWLINYDNAMRLKDRLCAKGAKVIFLQGKKRLIMNEIKKPENNADMFISVHVNSHDKQTQDRTQIYYARQNQSKKLANLMENKFDKWIPENENISGNDKFTVGGKQDYAQSKHANYDVLTTMEKNQNKPGVLWEVAFMVSPKGRERMSNPELMTDYAKCMADAVVDYFKG